MACMQASALPAGTPAGICRASHSKPRKEKTFALQLESYCQHASLNQGCMHPTLQVRTDLLLGPHGLLEAALRAYTSRHSRDAFAFHATAFLPMPCCAGSIFATHSFPSITPMPWRVRDHWGSAWSVKRPLDQDADSETQESRSTSLCSQPQSQSRRLN